MAGVHTFMGSGPAVEVDDEHLPCFHNVGALDGAQSLSPAECVDVFNLCLDRHIIQPLTASIEREAAAVADLSARLEAAIEGSATKLDENRSRLIRLADIITACQSSMSAAFPSTSVAGAPESVGRTGGPAPSIGESSFAHPNHYMHVQQQQNQAHNHHQQRQQMHQVQQMQIRHDDRHSGMPLARSTSIQMPVQQHQEHQQDMMHTQHQGFGMNEDHDEDSHDKTMMNQRENNDDVGNGVSAVVGTESEEDSAAGVDQHDDQGPGHGFPTASTSVKRLSKDGHVNDDENAEENEMLMRAAEVAEAQAALDRADKSKMTTRHAFGMESKAKNRSKRKGNLAERATNVSTPNGMVSTPNASDSMPNHSQGKRMLFGIVGDSSVKSGTNTNGSRGSG
jgi:hypothetical protein